MFNFKLEFLIHKQIITITLLRWLYVLYVILRCILYIVVYRCMLYIVYTLYILYVT